MMAILQGLQGMSVRKDLIAGVTVAAIAIPEGLGYAKIVGLPVQTGLYSALLLLLMAARTWRKRPAPGVEAPMPAWMAGIDDLKPGKALALGLLLAGVNPKNLMLSLAAGTGLAALGLSTSDAVMAVLFLVFGVDLISKGLAG